MGAGVKFPEAGNATRHKLWKCLECRFKSLDWGRRERERDGGMKTVGLLILIHETGSGNDMFLIATVFFVCYLLQLSVGRKD